jgi:EcsC protein family
VQRTPQNPESVSPPAILSNMTSVTPVFTEYERRVVHEIAIHQVQPNAIQRVLETIGKPVGRLFQFARDSQNSTLRGISDRVQGWVQEGLIKTIQVANRYTGTEEIMRRVEAMDIHVADIESMRYLPISKLDKLADSFKLSNRVLLGLEGAVLGSATTLAEGVPGAQLLIPSLILADVTASVTLLSRQTCIVASVYGFSPKTPENLPHLLAAMAPQTASSDEGYLAIKAAIVGSIRETSRFVAGTAGVMIDRKLLERESPQMIRLIAAVAERLGVTVTQKELGILVPVAGAVLNSSINLAFQQVSHQTAKDYFRRLLLEERYGDELIAVAISSEIADIRAGTPNSGKPRD